jgi:hypothetical protein
MGAVREQLTEEVRECLDCGAKKAARSPDSETKADFLKMEQRWLQPDALHWPAA